jgi:hypothetical protein
MRPSPSTLSTQRSPSSNPEVAMGTVETIAIVIAVYAVVFLAHQASRGVERQS